jgi:branched-chain amino acid transport system ATP-binding protein
MDLRPGTEPRLLIGSGLEIADRAYVLGNGRVVLQGSGAELLANDHVRKAYLGL